MGCGGRSWEAGKHGCRAGGLANLIERLAEWVEMRATMLGDEGRKGVAANNLRHSMAQA